jgi:hypothetical protein
MTDDLLLAERLRERLAAAEPVAPVAVAAVRARGWRRLRRRRWLQTGSAVLAVAAVAVGGAVVGGRSTDARPPVVEHGPFDPDALIAEVTGAVQDGGTPWTLLRVDTLGASGVVRKDDRADAQSWNLYFTDGKEHVLQVLLSYEEPFDEAAVQEDCLREVVYNDSCHVLGASSTSVTAVAERQAYRMGRSWPVVFDLPADRTVVGVPDPEDRWYLRTVTDFRADGLLVTAREVVHAGDAGAAAPLWRESTDRLAQLATDPEVWFPPFPGALQQGDRPAQLPDAEALAAELDALAATAGPPDETGRLSHSGQEVDLQPFAVLTNDERGRAYAQAHGLDFPFAAGTIQVPEGEYAPFALDAGTSCTEATSDGRERAVDCAALLASAEGVVLPVAVWRDGDRVVRISALAQGAP